MIRIRVAEPSDGESVAAIYAPIVRDSAISFEVDPPSGAVMAERIAATLPRLPWLVAVHDEEVLGYAYASRHRERAAYQWSVDVTVYVSQAARRSGVGRRLYRALLAILRLQGFRSAFAGIALPNPESVGLHEAMGFKLLGVYDDVGFKLGAWRSVGWWRLGLSTGDAPPPPPNAFADIRGSSALAEVLG